MSADATFSIELKDETSGAAKNAAGALADLKKRIDDDQKALAQMQAAMRRLKGGTTTNVESFRALSDQIAASKARIASAQAAYVSLGGTFEAAAPKAKSFSETLAALQRIVPAPILAIATALVALSAATVAATAALLRYGIAQADARRSELLRLEGLTTLRNRFGVAAGSAAELQTSIDRVSAGIALGRGEVGTYAQQLYRAGLRGEELTVALRAVGTAAVVQGERGARRIAGLAVSARLAGRSVRGVADDVERRLGGIARRHLLSLDVQSRKLHESFAAIFSGLNIERFLEGLHSVTELFSQNTASGRALKTIAEAVFQPMIDAITTLFPIGRRFFQGMVIGALLFVIAVQRVGRALDRLFGGSSILGDVDALQIALWAGVAAFAAMAVIGVALAGTFAGLAGTIAVLVGPMLAAVVAIGGLISAGVRLVSWFQAQDWTGLGRSLVDGLVAGIRGSASRVVQAVQGLAGSARQALTQALGIASPSRVFAALGRQIPAGLAQGVTRGAPIAAGAVDEMADGTVPSSRGSGSSVAISIGDIHINAAGGDAQQIARSFRDELARVLEGVAITVGAPA
jgi:hypothetical protein